MPARKDDLSRSGEPSQRTKTGLVIPVPERSEFFGAMDKAAKSGPTRDSRKASPRRARKPRKP
jgi:hypothetical protein